MSHKAERLGPRSFQICLWDIEREIVDRCNYFLALQERFFRKQIRVSRARMLAHTVALQAE
jgi:hypothetical protein